MKNSSLRSFAARYAIVLSPLLLVIGVLAALLLVDKLVRAP